MTQVAGKLNHAVEEVIDPAEIVLDPKYDASPRHTLVEASVEQPEVRESLVMFDPDIDLGPIRPEDEPTDNPTETKKGGGLSGMFRTVLYIFGALMILIVALVMFLRGNKGPSSEPPVTASVEVLESALIGRINRSSEAIATQSLSAAQEVANAPQEQSVQPHETVPVVLSVVAPGISAEPVTPAETVTTVIEEMQQVLSEHRALIQDQLEQNKTFRVELQDIRTSSEATTRRVDALAADIAQVRHSLEDLTERETKKVASLQRQLATKSDQARQQARQVEAQRMEPPPFRVHSVTLWGSDYLATMAVNSGHHRDVTVGELLDGWKIDAISATAVSVTRLRDGVKLNLAIGV